VTTTAAPIEFLHVIDIDGTFIEVRKHLKTGVRVIEICSPTGENAFVRVTKTGRVSVK
jgi:hypothetical protein